MMRLFYILFIAFGSSFFAAEKRPNIFFIYIEDLGYYTSERAAREPNAGIRDLKMKLAEKLLRSARDNALRK